MVFLLARDGGNPDECGVDSKLRHLLFLHGGVFHLRRRDGTFLGGICLLDGLCRLWDLWSRLWRDGGVGDLRRMSILMLNLFFVGLRTRHLCLLAWLVRVSCQGWQSEECWKIVG